MVLITPNQAYNYRLIRLSTKISLLRTGGKRFRAVWCGNKITQSQKKKKKPSAPSSHRTSSKAENMKQGTYPNQRKTCFLVQTKLFSLDQNQCDSSFEDPHLCLSKGGYIEESQGLNNHRFQSHFEVYLSGVTVWITMWTSHFHTDSSSKRGSSVWTVENSIS